MFFFPLKPCWSKQEILIGGLEHELYFPFHIWDVIDELHHFSRWAHCTTNDDFPIKTSIYKGFSNTGSKIMKYPPLLVVKS